MIFREYLRDFSHHLLTKPIPHKMERFLFSYQAKALDHEVKHAACETGQPYSDRNHGEKAGKSTALINLLQGPMVYTLCSDGKNYMLLCKRCSADELHIKSKLKSVY